MEYDIDLRKWLLVLFRRWRLILVVVLLTAISTATVTMLLPSKYTATASVLLLIRQTGSQLGTNEPLLTIETIDVAARRQGLVSLAESDAIEAKLPPNVLQQAMPANYQPGMLSQTQAIKVTANGDLLTIQATAATAQQAKLIVDAWASTYVAQVQELFKDQHSTVELTGPAILPSQPDPSGIVQKSLLAGFVALLFASLFVITAEAIGRPLVSERKIQSERPIVNPSPSR